MYLAGPANRLMMNVPARLLSAALVGVGVWGTARGQGAPNFDNPSAAAGILAPGYHHAVAVGDYNGDGWDDIYVGTTNGVNTLYRNNRDMTFTEVGVLAGVADAGRTYAAVWGDFDNDGDLDLATGNYIDPNRFYENNGDGTFTDRTVAYGVGHTGQCRSLHAADYDGDGWLDLFVVNLSGSNVLYRNLEGEGFADVTAAAGVGDAAALVSMGALFTDTDNDGDVDLYLTHDANQPNIHLRNNGNGTFSNTTAATGLGFVGNCMGVDAADINHDGWMDLYITNLYPSELFMNDGDGTFTPTAAAAGVNDSGMSWGCTFFDYDHDSEWDLYVVKDYFFSPQPNILYKGDGDGTFSYVSADSPVLRHPFSDYGLAQADLDRDGDRDLIIATRRGCESGNPNPAQQRLLRPQPRTPARGDGVEPRGGGGAGDGLVRRRDADGRGELRTGLQRGEQPRAPLRARGGGSRRQRARPLALGDGQHALRAGCGQRAPPGRTGRGSVVLLRLHGAGRLQFSAGRRVQRRVVHVRA